ncbi:MAG: DUF262 domain-containing protein [Gemmatimonadaceae bacterium]|nr:DUF262 domain-containing protein [Gemmatimonadaceae bacterium]
MSIIPVTKTESLSNLITMLEAGTIKVNPRYQRSGDIWPARAKSFLVETVLLGMPIPRVLLHQIADAEPPHTSDIIDGQQRCTILRDFRNGAFSLTADVDTDNLRGKKYNDLPPRRKGQFNAYVVPLDVYSNATPGDIREVFRRLNYYTAPLNAAEQRHAQFYGELSRFAEEQAETWEDVFRTLRVFTKRQRTRKADQQLLAEVVDAMIYRISTPTAKTLRETYRKHDRQFSSAADFRRRFDAAKAVISQWTFLREMVLRKHYHMFAIILGVMHSQRALAALTPDLGPMFPLYDVAAIERRLTKLDVALRRKETRGRYAGFVRASSEKTNVRPNRLVRCRSFYTALTGHP